MQRIIILALLCLTGSMVSQNYRYYKPGQNFSSTENACLVIKNDKRTSLFFNDLDKYASFKAIKLVGFNKPDFDMDSLMNMVDDIMGPKVLILENCNLSGLTEPLTMFNELEEVHLLSNCIFDENSLFELLKDCPVKKIFLQKRDIDLATDSLHLLKDLISLQVSSNNFFNTPNKTERIQFAFNDNVHTVDLAYFGNFYKESKNKNVVINHATVKNKNLNNVQMACIKQPIPGIDINDTVYNFNAASGKKILYESGSEITVDKNAFVISNGENYTGDVKLFYREFRNPVEIMLSGIPMSTKVGDKMELFKSGGMYEISAYDVNGDQLKARSDTSIKINFALTDTSESFKFYSLNDNGSWTTTDVAVKPVITKKDKTQNDVTRAVTEYYGFLMSPLRNRPDTTNYEARFLDKNYLYTYRKDNLEVRNDSTRYYTTSTGVFGKKKTRTKAFFRIKYVKQTKNKEIIFTIVKANKNNYDIPRHILALLNRTYLYTGNLTKEEFRSTYNRQLLCWDLRLNSVGNAIDLNIKTDKAYISLKGKAVTLMDDGTCYVSKKTNLLLCRAVQRGISLEAKRFNRKDKPYANKYNDMNFSVLRGQAKDLLAYNYSKKYQNKEEKKMDFTAWKSYVKNMFPDYYYNAFQNDNEVGNALVKSGLGVKNIDCYIHSGQMEDVFVNYNKDIDSLSDEYNAILFKSINTSYPISKSYTSNSLAGYYFKKNENYIVRFSNNGFMQVTKPEELKEIKKGNNINIAYQQQHNVKNLTSKDITRLILD
ncbi:MAG: hypothetical protein H0W73_02145 [Bacteroidetes bacterium]|nr:hypothetical protein [Bacteroidota bacterium]